MKVARFFIQHVDEDSGLDGFVPLWVPKAAGFDPGTSFSLVHDMLEHRGSDQGLFHEELQALGRMVALRGIPNVGSVRNYVRSYQESLGFEIASAWSDQFCDVSRGDVSVRPPPPTALDGQAEDAIQSIARISIEELPKFLYDRYDEGDGELDKGWAAEFRDAVIGWMRIGYLDALRRYGQQDHGCWDVGHSAFNWMRDNEKRIGQLSQDCLPGSVLRLQFDTASLVMTDRLYEPDPELGWHPHAWLRNRIQHWKTARIVDR